MSGRSPRGIGRANAGLAFMALVLAGCTSAATVLTPSSVGTLDAPPGPTGDAGSPSEADTPSASGRSATPSGTPTPSQVAGYGYTEPTSAARHEFAQMLAESQGACTGVSVRGVSRAGRRLGHLYLVRLRNGAPGSPGVERALLSAVLGSLTGQGTRVTLAEMGDRLVASVPAHGDWYFAWQNGGDLAVYHGGSVRGTASDFVTHYLTS